MARRIPRDAFALYASLGTGRSYEKVAEQLGVSKRAIVRIAQEQGWQARVAEIDRLARAHADERSVESVAEMVERQTKILKVVVGRGLETLRSDRVPPAQAARVVLAALREERDLRLMPTGDHAEAEAREMARMICDFVAFGESRTQIDVDDDEYEFDSSAEMGEDDDEYAPPPSEV